jgi:hypothetical protein
MYTNDTTNGVVKTKIDTGPPAIFGAEKMLWQMGRRTVKSVRKAAPKAASTAVITILIASIFPLALFTVAPSIVPKAAATPNIVFRNGFEAGTNSTGNWNWTNQVSGTLSNDGGIVGSRSLKFAGTTNSSYGYARVGEAPLDKISDTMWVQMYVKVSPYPSEAEKKVEVLQIYNSAANPIVGIRLYKGQNDKEMIELKYYLPSPALFNYSGNLNLQAGTWYTLEFKMYRHATQGEFRVYINGMDVITMKNIDTIRSGTETKPKSMRVGAPYAAYPSSQQSWSAWVDDVQVSNTTRIGTAYTGPVFKDGFEKGLYENWDWSSTSSGTFSNDTSTKVEGAQSLKFAATSTTGWGYYSGSENFTNLGNTFWMQMYVRTDKYPHDSGDLAEFFELKTSSSDIAGLRLYRGSNGKEMIELKRYVPSTVWNYSTPLNIHNNTWQNIEFKYVSSSTAGEYRVFLNGSEIITITGLDTSSAQPDSIRVGAPSSAQSYPSWNLWVDAITVSDSRIGVAGPQNCGIELTSGGYIYAYGIDNKTFDNYLKYGLKGKSLITNPYICGTYQTDASVGGAMIVATEINGLWIELGWFKGNYTTFGMVAQSTPHYFRGYQQSGGGLVYTDISTWASPNIFPTVDHWATFTVNGDPNPGYYTWNSTIESNDHSTIVLTGASLTNSSSTQTKVMQEMHNTRSSGTAHFKDLQNAQKVGSTLSWINWGKSYSFKEISGYSPSYDPLESYPMSVNEYCMYTDPQVACP